MCGSHGKNGWALEYEYIHRGIPSMCNQQHLASCPSSLRFEVLGCSSFFVGLDFFSDGISSNPRLANPVTVNFWGPNCERSHQPRPVLFFSSFRHTKLSQRHKLPRLPQGTRRTQTSRIHNHTRQKFVSQITVHLHQKQKQQEQQQQQQKDYDPARYQHVILPELIPFPAPVHAVRRDSRPDFVVGDSQHSRTEERQQRHWRRWIVSTVRCRFSSTQ